MEIKSELLDHSLNIQTVGKKKCNGILFPFLIVSFDVLTGNRFANFILFSHMSPTRNLSKTLTALHALNYYAYTYKVKMV